MAMLATRCEADALDLVQDAMIKLVRKYSGRPTTELKPLFLKILENGILDWHRKEKLKKALFFWRNDASTELGLEESVDHNTDPLQQLNTQKLGGLLLKEIEALPLKQQQCFLLRAWEGLSIKETAAIMNINENSVKTHYFRALGKLQSAKDNIQEQINE